MALKKKKTKKINKKTKPIFAKAMTKKRPALIKVAEAQPIDEKGDFLKKVKIRIIGIGGGGGTIVSEIVPKVEKVSFVIANTDRQALKVASNKAIHFQFGESLTRGLGTGMNAGLGEEVALQEKDKIEKLLQGQDLCIIISCLGGGAGSGAASVFAQISKNLGNLTYGIFTLPFKFEGERKMEIAKEALKKIKPKLNAISIIPNERIFQIIDRNTPLKSALSAINKKLADNLEDLVEIIYEPGLINIDFADLRTALSGDRGKLTYLNTIKIKRSENAVQEAIEKVLNSPLYSYGIKGAKGVLLNIAGEDNLSIEEVNQISETVSCLLNKDAKIVFGISQGKKYADAIKTTLLAVGCGAKIFSEEKEAKNDNEEGKPKKIQKIKKGKIKRKIKTEKAKVPRKKNISKKKKKRVSQEKATDKKEEKTEGIQNPVEVSEEGKYPPVQESKPMEISRKNALQMRKDAEDEEKEMIEKEEFWETPAFLRSKNIK